MLDTTWGRSKPQFRTMRRCQLDVVPRLGNDDNSLQIPLREATPLSDPQIVRCPELHRRRRRFTCAEGIIKDATLPEDGPVCVFGG